MTLREALQEMVNAYTVRCPAYEDGKEAQDAWAIKRGNALTNARAALAATQEGQKPVAWISVKEKLPPLDQQVLVCDETEPTSINLGWRHEAESPAIRGCNLGYDGDSAIDPYISHWMPLPPMPLAAEQRNAEADIRAMKSDHKEKNDNQG